MKRGVASVGGGEGKDETTKARPVPSRDARDSVCSLDGRNGERDRERSGECGSFNDVAGEETSGGPRPILANGRSKAVRCPRTIPEGSWDEVREEDLTQDLV